MTNQNFDEWPLMDSRHNSMDPGRPLEGVHVTWNGMDTNVQTSAHRSVLAADIQVNAQLDTIRHGVAEALNRVTIPDPVDAREEEIEARAAQREQRERYIRDAADILNGTITIDAEERRTDPSHQTVVPKSSNFLDALGYEGFPA